MLKAFEVMAQGLATCTPDASVTDVAAVMRDRDIGDVLVVEDGKLCGIVTDRDLAMQALTGEDDPMQTPIHKFMTTKIVTGMPDWSLKQVAKIMAKHQIRRLPIVQDDKVVGIVSLGDVALYENREDIVSKSLKAVSQPINMSDSSQTGQKAALFGFALVTLAAVLLAWLNWSQSGQALGNNICNTYNDLTNQQPAIVH
jgi:CBS domain-containing protein